MRHAWKLAALTATGLLAAGVAAPSAMAADDCPNAKVRAQQPHAQSLPDCMAYEKVTGDEKGGGLVEVEYPVAPDGSRTSIYSNAPVPTSVNGHMQVLSAMRTSSGWMIQSLTPSWWGVFEGGSAVGQNPWWEQVSDDLSSALYRTSKQLDAGDQGTGTADLFRGNVDGSHTWLSAPVSGVVPPGPQAGSAPRFVQATPSLDRVLFLSNRVLDPAVDPSLRWHLWLYQDGHPLELVDRLPDGSLASDSVSDTNTPLALRSVTRDLRRVAFGARDAQGRNQVYVRIDVGTPQARTVLVSAAADGTPCPSAGQDRFPRMTEDGRYVQFQCPTALTDDAPVAGGFYVRHVDDGKVEYWGSAQATGAVDLGSPFIDDYGAGWTRPDGRYRVERGAVPGSPGTQVFRVDLATGERVCASCPADGGPPTATSGDRNGAGGGLQLSMQGLVGPDGAVVFHTKQQLVPEDSNAFRDVYLWKDGRHYLLTSGTAGVDTTLGGMSLDGSTVSFSTTSAMTPDDRDNGRRDVYVVRKGGGFLHSPGPAECVTGCQGSASLPGAVVAPLSVGFTDGGNLPVEPASGSIGVSGSRSVRGTSLKVKVRVPARGRLTASGNGLRRASRSLTRATTATMTVRLSARSQRLLRTRSSLQRRLTVRYAPVDGEAQSKRVTLTFRKAQAKKRTSSRKASSKSRASASAGKGTR